MLKRKYLLTSLVIVGLIVKVQGLPSNSHPNQDSANPPRSAFETYKLLDKRTAFKISSKFPAQKYLHADYFVKYRKRPRSQLPYPVQGKDRFDGYLTFLVIGEMGVYIRRIEQRWMDFNTTKNREGMKALVELKYEDPRIVSCQMNSNETVFSVGYSNFTIET